MLYLISMKKVKIKYESYIFQEEHVDRFNEETFGEIFINDDVIELSCSLNSSEGKEKTIFTFKEDFISIKRSSYTLKFKKNELLECENKTQYGSIIFTTKLKKYLKLGNQFVVNYELLIGKDSIGSYVLKISYEEMN